MPIFDFKCPECGTINENVFLKNWFSPRYCEKRINESFCLHKMEKIPSRFFADVFPPEGIFLEHVSSTGKRFHSKREMRQYAKKHDLELGAL